MSSLLTSYSVVQITAPTLYRAIDNIKNYGPAVPRSNTTRRRQHLKDKRSGNCIYVVPILPFAVIFLPLNGTRIVWPRCHAETLANIEYMGICSRYWVSVAVNIIVLIVRSPRAVCSYMRMGTKLDVNFTIERLLERRKMQYCRLKSQVFVFSAPLKQLSSLEFSKINSLAFLMFQIYFFILTS